MKDRFPRLYSYALDENIVATQVFSAADITSLFHLPLSRQAFQELKSMQQLLNNNPLSGAEDVRIYCWGEKYTSAKFYKQIHSHITVPKVFHWLWKSCYIMKSKTFA
jgi:hypothetical protein